MLSDRPPVTTGKSDVTLTDLLERFRGNASLRERLAAANVIIVPVQPRPNDPDRVVPSNTRELLAYLERADASLRVEVATDQKSPPELVLHGELITLGTLLVQSVVAPLVVGVLTNYVWSRLEKGSKGDESATVRCEIVVAEEDGSTRSIRYEGPAATFENAVRRELSAPRLPPSTDQRD